jgi:hypothetical protein
MLLQCLLFFSYTSCGSSSTGKVCYKSLFNIFEGTAFLFHFPFKLSTQEKKISYFCNVYINCYLATFRKNPDKRRNSLCLQEQSLLLEYETNKLFVMTKKKINPPLDIISKHMY